MNTITVRSSGRVLAAAAVAVLLALTGVIATPQSASAAIQKCDRYIDWGGPDVPAAMGNAGSHVTCYLDYGTKNMAVGVLQVSIQKCYYRNVAIDDIYGPATRNAVTNIQKAAGISADGVYGPDTRSHMRWYDPNRGKCFMY